MNICKNCGKEFPNRININGKIHVINTRSYCLECSPFGKHNIRKLESYENIYDDCIVCGKKLINNQSKYCSILCKQKWIYQVNGNHQTREQKIEIQRNIRKKKKELINKILGDRCLICGYNNRLTRHQINGKKHKLFSEMSIKELKKYIEINYIYFVSLCFKCHKHVHWCMKYLGMDWEEIIERFINNKKV